MYLIRCSDVVSADCTYVANAPTEEEVIKTMMEHLMVAHPARVQEMLEVMTRDQVADLLRENIRRTTP